MKNLQDKSLTFLCFIESKNEKFSLLWPLIKIINSLILLLLIVKDELLIYCTEPFSQSLLLTVNILMADQKIQWVIPTGGGMELLLLLLICLYITFFSSSGKSTKLLKIGEIFGYISLLICMLAEITYLVNIFYLIKFIQNLPTHQPFEVVLWILDLLLILEITLLNYQSRLFNIFLLAIPFLLVYVSGIVMAILLLIICLFFFYRSIEETDKSLYACLGCACIWKIMELSVSEHNPIGLAYLLVSLGLILIVANSKRFSIRLGDEEENNRFLMQIVFSLEGEDPKNLLTITTLKIEAIMRQFFDHSKQFLSRQTARILSKQNIKTMSNSILVSIVDVKLKFDLDRNPTIETYKNFFIFRLRTKYKTNEALIEISKFLHNSKLQKKSLKHEYLLKKIELDVQNYFLTNKFEKQKIYLFTNLSETQKKFVESSVKTLDKLIGFWKKIDMPYLIEEKIEENMIYIFDHVHQMELLFFTLLENGFKANSQLKLMEFVLEVTQPYELTNFEMKIHREEMKQKADQFNSLCFFIKKNKTVRKISHELLKELVYVASEIEEQEIWQILPNSLNQTCDEKQHEAIQGKKSELLLPCITSKKRLKMFECNIKLFPELNCGIEFIYILKPADLQPNQSYIYVNSVSNEISFVSQEFIRIFNIDPEIVNSKIEKRNLFLNNFIINEDSLRIFEELKVKKNIKAVFSTKTLTNQANRNEKNFPGFLSLVCKYKNYCLLLVTLHQNVKKTLNLKNRRLFQSNKQEKTSFHLISMERSDKRLQKQEKAVGLAKTQEKHVRKNTEFGTFCLVENPYKQKIEEKQTEMSSENKRISFTYSNCIIVLFLISLVLVACLPFIYFLYTQQLSELLLSSSHDIMKGSDHVFELLTCIQTVFWQYTISTNKQKMEAFFRAERSALTVDETLLQLYKDLHQEIRNFSNSFLHFYHRKELNEPYQIEYKDFNVSVNFQTSNLIDFQYNIKLASELIRSAYAKSLKQNINISDAYEGSEHPLTFILKNYVTLSNLKKPFQVEAVAAKQIENAQIFASALISGIAFAYLAIVIASIYMMHRSITILNRIFKIFLFIPELEVEKQIEYITKQTQICMQGLPNVIQAKVTDLKEVDSENNLLVSQIINSESYREYQDVHQNDPILHQYHTKNLLKTRENFAISRALSEIRLLLAFAIFFIFLYAIVFYLIHFENVEGKQLLSFIQQLRRMENEELESSTDMYYNCYVDPILKSTNQKISKPQTKKGAVNLHLGNNYNEFFKQESILLGESLCSIKDTNKLYEAINCPKIGGGILTKGLLQSSQFYDYLTFKLSTQSMNFFDNYSNFPAIINHQYSQNKIKSWFFKEEETLLTFIDRNKKKKRMLSFYILIPTLILTLAGAVIFITKEIENIKKIRKVGIGYFQIFPESALDSGYVTSYLREEKILDEIGLL